MSALTATIADNDGINIHDLLPSKDAKPAKSEKSEKSQTLRGQSNWLTLMIKAIGSPLVVFDKTKRLLSTFYYYLNVRAQKRRLQRLKDLGFISEIPTQKQLWFGAIDMLRFFIKPGAQSYLKSQGLSFWFHQVLRILNDPSGMSDPIGIRVPRDTVICHLLEVTHANPVYDFQLLEQYEDGLEQLELQTSQMLAGTHARHQSISAIVEEPAYHQRLLTYVKEYRKDRGTSQMIRKTGEARQDRHFILAEMTFGTLPSVFRYINRLPKKFFPLFKHLRKTKHIQQQHCDEHVVEQYRSVFG